MTKKVNNLLETLPDKNIASALNIVWVWKSPFSMALRCSDISNKEDFLIFKCCSLLGFMMYIVSKTCRAAFCRDRAMTFWQQWKQPLVFWPLKWEESGLLKPIWHFFTWIQQLTTKNVYYEAFDEIFIICLLFIKGLTKQQLIAMCELMIIEIICWNFTHWLFPRNYVNANESFLANYLPQWSKAYFFVFEIYFCVPFYFYFGNLIPNIL